MLMGEGVVIKARNLSKTYKLYGRHADRVKETFHPLRKRFHHLFNALNDVSLDVNRGETVGIIGRNGSGKSTLLQIICGVLQPTYGNVWTNGRISALLELGAGFNPQFTGRENVYVNGAILGLSHNDIERCLPQIVDFADIGEFIDQPVKNYSSGMYVRLAFAVAINVNPDILIVDEALAVGDTLFQAKCFAKFKEFQEQGITILFVSHSLDLILRYCSSAYLLEKGSIHASGSPKDVVDEYNRLIVNCSGRSPDVGTATDAPLEIGREKQWEGMFQVNHNENRYGNGKAEIFEAGIFDVDGRPLQTLMQRDTYEFRLKIRFKDTIHEPIFAYTIKDVKGLDISGTNTLYQNVETGTVNDGDVFLATFKTKILLNSGGYLLSVGCAGLENGGYVVYERRYDYMAFDVVSDRAAVGLVDLDSEIEIKRI